MIDRNLESIIDNLIHNFSIENLTDLIFHKDERFNFSQKRITRYEDERFEEVYQVGDTRLEDGTFSVFVIKHSGELTERTSKKKQFELAKKILRDSFYDAGFFIFYDEKGNFRFSLVHSIYKGIKREFSHYKRYTYYVEKGRPYRTFKKALYELEIKDLNSILKAFAIKPLIKEFYTEVQNWYAWALKEDVWFPGGNKEENLIRLITRIIFVWFLREKKLVPQEIFDEGKLEDIVKDFRKKDYYYNVILQNLFFATLNRYPHEREFAEDKGYPANIKEFGVKNLFRYEKFLKIPKEDFIKLFEKVPFINGGLFECLDEDKNYIDGFSRNENKRAKIPDYLFFSLEREEDLSHFYGEKKVAKVRGLINILKDYNFTADESSPIDVEASLDPELLGHIFENLLASYNPETKTSARKQTGSYYTPKEIVDFMIDESLVQYFKTHTPVEEKKLRKLISYSEESVELNEEESNALIEAIDKIKIIDPAVGSGAFPMGTLHKLVHLLSRLDSDNKKWYEIQYNKALKEVENVLRIEDKEKREKLLKEINDSFDEALTYPDYARKLYIIQNSIYGVDIQNIAIQICKLRFFLSLLIDQKIDPEKENYGIKPLPHLETNFVCADFLIGLKNYAQGSFGDQTKLKERLKELYKKHFSIKTREEKNKIQKEARKIREEMKEILIKSGWRGADVEKIVSFDIFDQRAKADWFDPEWMFGVEDGFDIVIGNPPYIQLQKDGGKLAERYKNQNYETYVRTGDVYTLFYEIGIKILKPKGHLCFITSNKWMRAGYGEKLREFFTKYNPILLIDLGPDVFESSTVDTNILIVQKAQTNVYNLKALTLKRQNGELNIRREFLDKAVVIEKLDKKAWFIGSSAEQRLKEKIERISKPLKDWDVKIYRGLTTGLNEAFIITTEKRNEILANCKDEEERMRTEAIIKPILRGRDIKRYYYEWAGLWVIVIPAGWTNKNKGKKNAENFIEEQFPSLLKHLKPFEERAKKRDDQGDYWWELRKCAYYPEFEKEKVVWQRITQEPTFCMVEPNIFVLDSMAFFTGQNLKFIMALLNSKLIYKYAEMIVHQYGFTGFRLSNQYVEIMPLPPITPENQSIVKQTESLVDKILAAKKQNPLTDTSEWEREIDWLVYKLYDLTEDEIKIVEGEK